MKPQQFYQLNKAIEPFLQSFSNKITITARTARVAPEIILEKGHYFLKEITALLISTPVYKENQLSVNDLHSIGSLYNIFKKQTKLEFSTHNESLEVQTNLNNQIQQLLSWCPKKFKNNPVEVLEYLKFEYKISIKNQRIFHTLLYQESLSSTKWLFVYDYNFKNRHLSTNFESQIGTQFIIIKEKLLDYYNEYDISKAEVNEIDMASKLGLSLPMFRKCMKEFTGYTLWQYHLDQRLQRALHDLIFSNKTYEELAFAYGFNNYKTFKRAIEKHYKTKLKHIKDYTKKNI